MSAPMASVNIASHLKGMARRRPEQLAVLFPAARVAPGRTAYTSCTYQRLDSTSDLLAEGLKHVGIGRGTRTVLMVPPSLEFFALTFALFKVGAVPVFVDPGMGLKNIGKCLKESQPAAFIGVAKAHLARRLFGWSKDTLRHLVGVGHRAKWCWWMGRNVKWWDGSAMSFWEDEDRGNNASDEDDEFCIADTTADETAAILFTSGSTGVPKGAVYSHGNFAAQIEMLRTTFSIQPGEVDLCTFPLFALFAPALGMTAVVPRMDFTRPATVDPFEIASPIGAFHVANLFGSPALLNRVGRFYAGDAIRTAALDAEELADVNRTLAEPLFPSLRRVLSAGAPVSPAIIERFSGLLSPGVQIFTPYGATEALPVAVIGSDEILMETRHKTVQGAGTCVGRPVKEVQVSIIQISDDPIGEWSDSLTVPQGEVGEIVVSGPNVTQEYFNRPDLTAMAKIRHPETGRMRHRMGDLGYFDDQGRLWFCGRKSHRVVMPERTIFAEQVEGVFNAHPAVFRTALVGVMQRGAMQLVLCVEREKVPSQTGNRYRVQPNEVVARELLELGARYELTRPIQTILFHKSFPVDIRHNSKIFREKLAVWAAKRLRK